MARLLQVCLGLAATSGVAAQKWTWAHMESNYEMEFVPAAGSVAAAISVSIACPAANWCGFGFNTAAKMDGSDVFTFGYHGCCDSPASIPARGVEWISQGISWPAPTGTNISLTQCNLIGYTIEVDQPASNQNIYNRAYTSANGVNTVKFSRLLDTGDAGDYILDQTTNYYIHSVQGSSVNVGYHGTSADQTKTCQIKLGTAGIVCSGSQVSDLRLAHAALMAVAWLILIPMGVFSSRFGRTLLGETATGLKRWFLFHRVFNSLGWLLTLIAVVLIIIDVGDKGAAHFSSDKMVLGLVVAIFSLLQPLNAYFRPHVTAGEDKSTARKVWEVVHKGSGFVSLIVGQVTCALGASKLGDAFIPWEAICAWSCAIFGLAFIAEIRIRCLKKAA